MSKYCGKNVSNSHWLTDDCLKSWLQKVSCDTAKCKICYRTFSVTTVGISNVISSSNEKMYESKVLYLLLIRHFLLVMQVYQT